MLGAETEKSNTHIFAHETLSYWFVSIFFKIVTVVTINTSAYNEAVKVYSID